MSEELKLSERAMLVKLTVGKWANAVTDQAVTEKVLDDYKAKKGAGKWTKVLVASKYLHNVGVKISSLTTTHKYLTLPWEDKGPRILAAQCYMDYTSQIQTGRLALEAAVDAAFDIERLIEYKAEARVRLANQYNDADYPTADEIKAKFYVDTEFKPIPEVGDFRTKLADKTIKSITKDIERRTEERLKTATSDIYQRIVDVVEKMVERLKVYEPAAGGDDSTNRFRDSLVYNVHEVANLLPSLNITGDPKIEEMRQRLLSDLTEHSPDILRIDSKARSDTARKAEKILAKARQYLS